MKVTVEITQDPTPRAIGTYDWAVKAGGKTLLTGNSETFLGAVAQAAVVPIDHSTGKVADHKVFGWCINSEADCLAKFREVYLPMAEKKAATA